MKTTKILKSLFTSSLLFSYVFVSQGCFNELDSNNATAIIDKYYTSDDFSGATEAVNIISGIEISWTPVANGKKCIGYRIYRFNFNTPQLLSTVDADAEKYVDGSAVSGVGYRYMVRAVDPDNVEDDNVKVVSGIAWSGLTSVASLTNDSLTAYFNSRLQGYNIKISLQGENRAKTEIIRLTSFSQIELGSYTITEWPDRSKIKPGATYQVYAEIIDASTGKNDGNKRPLSIATKSYGFDSSNAYPAGWNNIATARAFGRSPGTDPIPETGATAGSIVPRDAQVELGFLPFTLPPGFPTNLYRYNIIRFGENVPVETAANLSLCAAPTSAEASETAKSLLACILPKQPGSTQVDFHPTSDLVNGYFSVRDTTVWHNNATGKPPRYRYLMALKHLDTASDSTNNVSGYREFLPLDKIKQFSVVIAIPPNDMVLVSREAANYEFCKIQKGLVPDPLKNNRCIYSEIGSVPYNSGPGNSALNLDSNYYDAGYSLFVDRYPLACNSTRSNITNSLTTSTIVNGLIEYKPRAASTTVNTSRDVMYSSYTNIGGANTPGLVSGTMTACSYYDGSLDTWLNPSEFDANLGVLADQAFRDTLSNKPSLGTARGRAKFSYPNWDSRTSMLACNSFSETGYGEKRIPRLREYRIFSAPPFNKRIAGALVTDYHYARITSATSVNNPTLAWYSGGCNRGNILPAVSNYYTSQTLTMPVSMTDVTNGIFTTDNLEKMSTYQTGAISNFADFFIGSKHTADCMSKYGVANILETSALSSAVVSAGVTTSWSPVSDAFYWKTTDTPFASATSSGTLYGRISNLDNGNTDVSVKYTTSLEDGFAIEGEGNTSHKITLPSTSTSATVLTRFNAALGLPVPSDISLYANSDLPAASINYNQTTLTYLPYSTVGLLYGRATARYSTAFTTTDAKNTRVRCVMPAE